jgi:uncharacterized surface protein with fasciclin (FAS1) repeats
MFRKSMIIAATVAASAFFTMTASAKDIVDTAVGAGNFKTLVAAVQAAGLVDTLKGKGPFTVFAPTDEAFAALPAGTVESLLKPENKDKLVKILAFHVLPREVGADHIVGNRFKAKTVQGQRLTLDGRSGSVRINKATVVAADVEADNGVIHVIDRVLLPK